MLSCQLFNQLFFLYMREEYAVEDQHQHVVGGKNQRKGQNARLVATEKESSDEDDDECEKHSRDRRRKIEAREAVASLLRCLAPAASVDHVHQKKIDSREHNTIGETILEGYLLGQKAK